MAEYKSADTVGPWTLEEYLGSGGNATVWRASHPDGRVVALKILFSRNPSSEPYARFRREVETLSTLGERASVLPLLESSLPERPTRTDPAWLAMPVAQPLAERLQDADLEQVIGALLAVADALAALHDEGISHRDIKPSNLYEYLDAPAIGDFGLVALPEPSDLTEVGKPFGARNFAPYEFIADPADAAGPPADVFMFVKTLWVLSTDQRWPPQGEQRADNIAMGIGGFRSHPRSIELDALIERGTRHAPGDRPPMREVANDLRAWLSAPSDAPEVIGLAEAAARLRTAASSGLNAEARRAQLHSVFVGHDERLSALLWDAEDELSAQFPITVRDGFDELAQNVLQVHEFLGSTGVEVQEVRATTLLERRDFPDTLIVGRGLALTDDGNLHVDGMCFMGPVEETGGDFLWRFETNGPHPIESIQAEREVRRLAATILEHYPEWVDAFARHMNR